MRSYLMFLLLLGITVSNLVLAMDSAVSNNCSPTRTTAASPAAVKTSGKEVTVIQTVDSCPKTQSGPSSQGIELIEKSAKYALDNAAEATRKSAEFSEKTLEHVKNFILWMGAGLTFLIALAAGFGWKSISDLKSDIVRLSRRHISAARLRFDKQTAAATADFNAQTTESLKQFEQLKKDLLKELANTDFARNFFLIFTIAKNESMQCEHPRLKTEFMGSALFNYQKLIKDVDLVNKAELSEFINDHLLLRKEKWDEEIIDDAIFMKCWIYQDIAYLQKRLGRINEAAATCREALKICPTAWSIIFNLSCYECLNKQYTEAKENLEKCMKSPYAKTFAQWALDDSDFTDFFDQDEATRSKLRALST